MGGGAADGASGTAVETTRPPPILMRSKAGTQRAVQESFCVSYVDAFGTSVFGCGDTTDLLPRRLSVVRPGDRVQIRLRGARVLKRAPGCGPSGRCEAGVAVSRLGCPGTVARFDLKSNRTTWRARLAPGAYELEVFVGRFAIESATGDTSGSLGLLVDRDRPREKIGARGHVVCR
jgi:hypothetical protein